MTKQYTPAEIRAILHEQWEDELDREGVRALVNSWVSRGDGAAVYRNEDLGSAHVGQVQIVSFGSPRAQLEIPASEDLPQRLPDIGGAVNWRYSLEGTYRGEVI